MVPLSAQNATKLGQEDLCTVGVQCLALVVGRGQRSGDTTTNQRKEDSDKYTLGACAHNRANNQDKGVKEEYIYYL